MSDTLAIRHPGASRHPGARRRIVTLPVRCAVRRLAYMDAVRQGCCGRVARWVAKYAEHLRSTGHSAGWSLGRAAHYSRVLAGQASWDGLDA